MREYGAVNTRFWLWAQESSLSDAQKVIALYILTNPHGNSLGCFRLPASYAAEDTGYSPEQVEKEYRFLIEKGFISYCSSTKYILIKKYLKWNPIQNKKHGIAIGKIVARVPDNCSILKDLYEMLQKFGAENVPDTLLDTLCHRVSIGYSIQYRYTDQDQDQAFSKEKAHPDEEPEAPPGPPIGGKIKKLTKKKTNAGNQTRHYSNRVGMYIENIRKKIDKIEKLAKVRKWKFNIHAWIQQKANIRGHPKAIDDSLGWLIDHADEVKSKNPWGFIDSSFQTLNPKYNEADHIVEAEAFKTSWAEELRPMVAKIGAG